jgi:hypothetical protein
MQLGSQQDRGAKKVILSWFGLTLALDYSSMTVNSASLTTILSKVLLKTHGVLNANRSAHGYI